LITLFLPGKASRCYETGKHRDECRPSQGTDSILHHEFCPLPMSSGLQRNAESISVIACSGKLKNGREFGDLFVGNG
jgi:hypothetical protein